jgi:hypothetical protein
MALKKSAIPEKLEKKLTRAWDISRSIHGYTLLAHIPGMFVVNGVRGRHRAVSITGAACDLSCEHCKGLLLKTMPWAQTPEALKNIAIEARARGDSGLLITGGCDSRGRLPWGRFLETIHWIKKNTGLTITAHPGQVDEAMAVDLKASGVDQALVDIIGDDETANRVCHLPKGAQTIVKTLDALFRAGLEVAPHIVCGLYYGKMKGEHLAIDLLTDYPFRKYIIVVLTPAKGASMEKAQPPLVEDVAQFIADARLKAPRMESGLGCARPRGRYAARLDRLAVIAGVNSIALASDLALDEARSRGLTIERHDNCCSLGSVNSGPKIR